MSTDTPQQTMAPPGENGAQTPASYEVEAPDVERNRLGVNLAWEGLLLVFIALAIAAWFLLGGVAFESLDAAGTQLAGVAPYLLLATALAMTMRLGAAHLGLGLYAVLAAGIYAQCVALGLTLPAALGVTLGAMAGLGALTALLVTVFRIPGWAAGLATGVMGLAVLSVPYGEGLLTSAPNGGAQLAPLQPAAAWAIVAAAVLLSLAGGVLGLAPGLRQVLVNCRDAASQKGKRGASGVLVTWLGLLGASVIAGGAGILSLVPNPGSWAITLAQGDRILPIAIALSIVLLGGTGLRGGRGGVFGTVLATIVYYMVAFVMLQANLDLESYFLLPVGALLVGMVVHWAMDLANRPRRIPGLVYANGVPLLANPPQPVRPEPQHTSLEALLDSGSPAQQPPQLVDPAVAAQIPPTLEDPTAAQQPAPPVEASPAGPSKEETPTAIPQQPDPDTTVVVPARQREEPAADTAAAAQESADADVTAAAAAQQRGESDDGDATAVVPAQQRPESAEQPVDEDVTAAVPEQQRADDDPTAVVPAQQRDSAPEGQASQQDASSDDSTVKVSAQSDPSEEADGTVVIAAQRRDEDAGEDTTVIPEQADATTAIPQPESATAQPPANEDGTANIPAQQRGTDDDDTTSIAVQDSEEDDSADTTALPRQRRQSAAPDSADTTALPSQTPVTTPSESSVVSESAPPEDDSSDTAKLRPKKTEAEEPETTSDDSTAAVTPPEPPPTSSNSESYLYRPPT